MSLYKMHTPVVYVLSDINKGYLVNRQMFISLQKEYPSRPNIHKNKNKQAISKTI